MKHNLKVVYILCVLILFLSSCASTPTSTFYYEYPEEMLVASGTSIIAIASPEDERWPDGENNIIWSDDPVKEMGKVIHTEIKSTGLFREVLYIDKEDKDRIIESGARVVLYPSVLLLAWAVPFPPEPDDIVPIVGLHAAGFTDLYGKAKIMVRLVDQDTGQNLIEKEYYSSVRKTMPYWRTDLYRERKKIIGKALKEIMGQLTDDLQQLSK